MSLACVLDDPWSLERLALQFHLPDGVWCWNASPCCFPVQRCLHDGWGISTHWSVHELRHSTPCDWPSCSLSGHSRPNRLPQLLIARWLSVVSSAAAFLAHIRETWIQQGPNPAERVGLGELSGMMASRWGGNENHRSGIIADGAVGPSNLEQRGQRWNRSLWRFSPWDGWNPSDESVHDDLRLRPGFHRQVQDQRPDRSPFVELP